MNFNIEDYQGNYCMHCKTEEEAENFCGYLHKKGRKWASGLSYLTHSNFYVYKENTVYYFNEGTFSAYSLA